MWDYESPCDEPLALEEAPPEVFPLVEDPSVLPEVDPSVLPEVDPFVLEEPLTVELSPDEDPESVLLEVPEVVVVEAEALSSPLAPPECASPFTSSSGLQTVTAESPSVVHSVPTLEAVGLVTVIVLGACTEFVDPVVVVVVVGAVVVVVGAVVVVVGAVVVVVGAVVVVDESKVTEPEVLGDVEELNAAEIALWMGAGKDPVAAAAAVPVIATVLNAARMVLAFRSL